MACGTVVGQALEFGIASDEASLVTQSVGVTRKTDKKEARDKCGIIVSAAFYNPMADVSIEGLGSSEAACGSELTLAGDFGLGSGKTYIDEVAISKANEDFVKSSIKATYYSGITA